MPWNVQYHAELQIVEIRFIGQLTSQELHAALEQAIASSHHHDTYRCLADCSELQGGHSIVDLFNLADMLAALQLPRFREAVLMPQLAASRELISLWETACFNRGLQVRVFESRPVALEWLCHR